MVNGIEISREDAYFLHRLLTDIIEIDGRARCSDSYFRSHFMSVIKSGLASGAYQRLDKALTTPVETSTEAKPKKTK